MVHRKGGYKCTHKSQNHRSRSLPQTPISVMESSKPGIESCSKWLHASGTGSNMVHKKVGYDMCLCILYNVRARNQIIAVVSVKLRLFELLLWKHCYLRRSLEGKGEKRLQRDNCFPD